LSNSESPVVGVLIASDSFLRVWEGLERETGAPTRIGRSLDELAPLGDLCALLLSTAGIEGAAPELIQEARTAGAGRIAVVTAAEDHRLAMAVMLAGAAGYFALPGDLERMREWVRERVERERAVERASVRSAYERQKYDFSRMAGRSPRLLEALERAARVIPRDSVTLLITGETGTGKELLAEAVHYNGPRARQPFVEVNCAALPENLLEAELFGYERGAFTDAKTSKPGLFEAAHRGTLFLDEVGELTPPLQAKLLKVLEDKRIRRLGSVRTVEVDVRIIAATHADLPAMVRQGRFRRDLFYRFNVLTAELPPLRDRGDDVILLTEHFLEQFSRQYDLPRPPITPAVRQALLAYPWPGNVRELRNGVERAILMGDGALRVEDLIVAELSGEEPTGGDLPFPASMTEIEVAAARAMVARYAGNKTAAAEALGISRTRLYRLIEEGGGDA
jgi:transcriptional regulator with PAS, ATPase and Fis domain